MPGDRQEHIAHASQCLKAMAHPIRLAILCALRHGELPVNALEQAVGTSQSLMSTHLGHLRNQGLVASRRAGSQVFYRLATPALLALLHQIEAVFCQDAPDPLPTLKEPTP